MAARCSGWKRRRVGADFGRFHPRVRVQYRAVVPDTRVSASICAYDRLVPSTSRRTRA